MEESSFEQPKPGLYPAKIDSCEPSTSKNGNEQLTVTLRISSGDYKGALLWHYVPTDPDAPGAFRMAELLKVLGVSKKNGTLDTDKAVGTPLQVRVKADSYQGEYKGRVGAILPGKNGNEPDEDLEDDATPEPDDAEEAEAEDDEEAEDDGAKEDASDEEDDYDEWEVAELKNELKERNLRTAGNKAALIKRLRKDDTEEDDDPFS